MMAVELDLTAIDDLQLLRLLGPWSINADAHDRNRMVHVQTNDRLRVSRSLDCPAI